MNFAHSDTQEEYFWHKYNLFKDFGGSTQYYEKEDKRTHNIYKKFTYTSRTHPILTDLHGIFYVDRHKIIPGNIEDIFNEVSLAYLFMDDGSHHKNGYYISLCNFEYEELTRFINMLYNKFELNCSIHSQKQLYIMKDSVANFNKLVEPYILPSMMYKIIGPSPHKTPLNGESLFVGNPVLNL